MSDAKKFSFYVLLILALWIPLKYCFRYNKIISLPDTRIVASEWIKNNSGRDYKIAWDKNSIKLKWFEMYNANDISRLTFDPERIIDGKRYNLSKELLNRKDWFKILKKKVDYVVINSLDSERVLRISRDKAQKKFYNKILKLKPKIVFSPYLKDLDEHTGKMLPQELYMPFLTLWQRERAGPVIRVYKI